MDGVFMKKFLKFCAFFLVAGMLVWLGGFLEQGRSVKENLVRLHVVANSDSQEDQALKLQVRDAVLEKLNGAMEQIPTAQEAKDYLAGHLQELEAFINAFLQSLNREETASVSLQKEEFPTRHYDTFSLPAGVYDSLRITIGQGQGQNWWCVIFPTLCLPATSEGFQDTAAGAGFSEDVTNSYQRKDGYQVRFFLLDCFGWVENFFHRT